MVGLRLPYGHLRSHSIYPLPDARPIQPNPHRYPPVFARDCRGEVFTGCWNCGHRVFLSSSFQRTSTGYCLKCKECEEETVIEWRPEVVARAAKRGRGHGRHGLH